MVALLTADARLAMPPQPWKYHGRRAICDFLSAVVPAEGFRMLPTRAAGRPAFAFYERGGPAHGLLVVDVVDDGIAALTAFTDPGVLAAFGFPASDAFAAAAVSETALLRGRTGFVATPVAAQET